MQLLASTSEEFGLHSGLGLISGKVKSVPRICSDGSKLKVPLIGWSPLILNSKNSPNDSCLSNSQGKSVYLVHSYHLEPDNPANLLASYIVNGQMITAAVRYEKVTGVQFHPEKSGSVGLEILRKFINT